MHGTNALRHASDKRTPISLYKTLVTEYNDSCRKEHSYFHTHQRHMFIPRPSTNLAKLPIYFRSLPFPSHPFPNIPYPIFDAYT